MSACVVKCIGSIPDHAGVLKLDQVNPVLVATGSSENPLLPCFIDVDENRQ
jgi:hypothetical protein